MKHYGKSAGVVTTVTRQNLPYLQELREDLIRMGVDSWQVQIGLPMGNLKERPEWLITPSEVDDIIDFCYDTMKDGRIRIYPADCIGYFNKQEQEVRRVSYQTTNTEWDGCNAGIRGFGILQNGDVLAVLLSVRVNLSRVTFANAACLISGMIPKVFLASDYDQEATFRFLRALCLRQQMPGRLCEYPSDNGRQYLWRE